MIEMHVYIEVTELRRGLDFYCDGVGLTLRRRYSKTWVELAGARIPVFLLADRPALADLGGRQAARDYGRHWTPVHLDFVVDDVEGALLRAEAAGAVREGDVRTARWGRIATLADPFGNGFCLIEFLNRGYDEIATRE
jgi:predicted enzyme related to lactoylglutathione lyase